MKTMLDNEAVKDIKKLLELGVMHKSIAKSMNLSKQAFYYRLSCGKFSIDEHNMVKKKFNII